MNVTYYMEIKWKDCSKWPCVGNEVCMCLDIKCDDVTNQSMSVFVYRTKQSKTQGYLNAE